MTHKKVSGFLCASDDLKKWRELPQGALIIEPGNSREYYTGGWRIFRPVVDKKRCINCLTCWMYCPDMSIVAENTNMEGYDYEHCKGCGTCAEICPVKCIKMVEESRFGEENKNKDFDERGRTRTVEIKSEKK